MKVTWDGSSCSRLGTILYFVLWSIQLSCGVHRYEHVSMSMVASVSATARGVLSPSCGRDGPRQADHHTDLSCRMASFLSSRFPPLCGYLPRPYTQRMWDAAELTPLLARGTHTTSSLFTAVVITTILPPNASIHRALAFRPVLMMSCEGKGGGVISPWWYKRAV